MRLNHAVRLLRRTFGTVALLALPWTMASAQVAAPANSGEVAVFSTFGALPISTNPGDVIDVEFSFDELTGINLPAPTTDIELSQGKYLVIYTMRFDNVSGPTRAEMVSNLSIVPAAGGAPNALPYGTAQGYIRNASGADATVLSGGTIVEAASAGDILRLSATRTDGNDTKIVDLSSNGTSIQLLKIADDWDYLRLAQSADLAAATSAAFEPIVYDVIDEASAGAMSFTTNTANIVFEEAGRYLVFANTHLAKNSNSGTRTGYTQRLTLDDAPLPGGTTTTYMRGNPDSDDCNDGVAAIGIIVSAGSGQTLKVETSKQAGENSTIVATGTGLAIVKLPSFGSFISLSDSSGQNINPDAATAMTFGTQQGTVGSAFSHTLGGSAITIDKAGNYLFLSGFYCNDDTNLRQVPWQNWAVDFTRVFYGGGSRYSRDLDVDQNGNWSGLLTPLVAGQTVEVTMERLGNGSSMPGDSLGLQGVLIDSLFPSVDPSLAVNNPLNIPVSTSATISGSLLQGADANSGPAQLTFTVDSAPTGGTLRLGGTAIGLNDTFTQVDIDNGDLTFDAGPTTGTFGFDLTIADEDGGPTDSGTFTVEVGLATVPVADTATTNEDTAISSLDGGATSVLDNDIGTGLSVVGHDALSAQGAVVSVASDGTFSYDPSGSAALQAIAVNEQVVDTFSYTLLDFTGTTTQVTVSITVDGVNDLPVLAGESLSLESGSAGNVNLLSNDSDTDASDVLLVANLEDAVFGQGGAVPSDTFNFEFVPLVFTTQLGATVSISADGSFRYDPSTSTIILGLNPGVAVTETFTYEVSDGSVTDSATVTVSSTGAARETADYGTTDADSTINIAVLDNDQVRKPGGALGTPTPGAQLEFLADTPGNSNTAWLNTGLASLVSIPEGGPMDATLNTSVTNAPPGISAAYTFAGTEGIAHLEIEQASYGDLDRDNASIEMVFRPTDQVGDEVIWETGGATDGFSITILGNQVVATAVDNGNEVIQAVADLPPGAVADGEFVHVVATIDLESDTIDLYVNAQLAGTGSGINVNNGNPADLDDWSGADDGGFGRRQTDVGGDGGNVGSFGTLDLTSTTDFAGEIAIGRAYKRILSPSEIADNFDAVFGTPIDAVPGDLIELAGTPSPSVGAPVVLPSGATVTLEADGSLTYDPNGAFGDVGQGLVVRDSFTYLLEGAGAPATVNVDVTGTNPNPQITVAAVNASVNEGLGTSFTISASAPLSGPVDVELSFSGLAEHTVDFTGMTSVQIADGGTSATLFTFVNNDGIYEGVENIIVTIDSVSGNAVLGGTLSAESIVNDAQSPPEFSIAADQGSFSESGPATFTITPSIPSQAPRTLALAHDGSATQGVDFFGPATVTIPGGAASGVLAIPLLDDAVAEGPESLSVTLVGVDIGTIGAGDSASIDITDGDGEFLLLAEFEGIDPADTPTGTLTGTDAPAAANLGTSVGSWEGVFTISSGGDVPGVINEADDVLGDGIDFALRLDRPGPADGDVFAIMDAPMDLTGSSSGAIFLDLGTRRTETNSLAKSYRIIGLDDSGERSFELFVEASNNLPNHEQLHYVTSGGELVPIGNVADFDNTNGWAESRQTRLVIHLDADGYQVAIDRFPIDGVAETITGVLPYAGTASQISRIHLDLSGSLSTGENSGMFLDNFRVSGTAGNIGPTATLDGTALAQGGSTSLPVNFIGTATVLDTLQVEDPDAGTAPVTATFESTGVAPLSFSATGAGAATVTGSGTGTLTIEGPIDSVNATLASGVTYTTDAVTGGDALIQFTISDNGNTGPGGEKILTHTFSFFVNEGPTVTIDLAPGQAGRTSTGPAAFSVTFSEAVTGFESSDVDLSASTAGGTLVAAVSGAGDSYAVEVTGMTTFGDVTISVPKGAANAAVGGNATEASVAIRDTVTFVPNSPPVATNLTQSINYMAGAASVEIEDIFVTDPNDSVVTTTQAPQVDYPAVDPDLFTLMPDPATDEGMALQLVFAPDSLDVLFGTVRVFEIGGTSNGTGVYLVDGVPHFIRKMNSGPATVPESLDDPDMGNGNISIPLAAAPLVADQPAILAIVASLDSITYSLNGMGATTVAITNRTTTQTNWSGDDSVRIGQAPMAGSGGLGTEPGPFDETNAFEMLGTVTLAQMWHAPDTSGYSIQAVDAPEELTATLSLPPGGGDLTAPAGATWDPVTGVWSITGGLVAVNTALAGVEFLPNGTSPVTIDVSIDDGDEDGSGPLTGAITLFTGALEDSDGDGIPDAFETANGLDPNDATDAASDSDGDGWSALDEYLMGTDLNDAGSSPFFDVVYVGPAEVQVIYGPILSGRTYDVLASPDGQSFSLIDSFTAGAGAATNIAIDTTGTLDTELYKLEVTVP